MSQQEITNQKGLGFALREAYRAFARELDVRLAKHHITHAQWVFLWFLQELGEQSAKELSIAAGIRKGSATPTIRALQARGLIAGRRDGEDHRIIILCLTARGQKLVRSLQLCANETNESIANGMKAHEVAQLIKLLQKVRGNSQRL